MSNRSNSIAHRIAAARLHRQFLIGTSPHQSPVDVVRAVGAVQSQDFAGAKWAVAMRSAALTEADIDRAYNNGEILRTHVLRPTWHFVAPADLRWMLALTGPRIAAAMASYNRKFGLDAKLFAKSRKIIERALAQHGAMTRAQLKVELNRARIITEGTQRLAHLVMQAELDAVICSGPRVGKVMTYMLVDERTPPAETIDRDEALLKITRRYFASRAPATTHDFSWWSGLTVGDCRRGIAIAGKELQSVTLDDKQYLVPPDFELPARIPGCAHLLPNYDEYFIGFRDRSAIGQRIRSSALVTGGTSLIAHVVAIDGQLVGGWRQRPDSQTKLPITLNLEVELTKPERTRLNTTIKRYKEYLDN